MAFYKSRRVHFDGDLVLYQRDFTNSNKKKPTHSHRELNWYMKLRIGGAKAIGLSKDGNAVFVKQLADVKSVLEAFRAAAVGGELDAYVETSISVRRIKAKKAA